MKRKPILSSPQSVILRLCEESLLLRHPCSKRSFAKFILERNEGLRMTACVNCGLLILPFVRHRFILLLALNLLWVSSGDSAPRNQLPVGTRPIGMGESFVAVADDANAIFWNPAGLIQLRKQTINTMYTDLYNIGLRHSYLGYAVPLTDRHAIGLDWAHLGFDDDELNYSDNRFSLSYGF